MTVMIVIGGFAVWLGFAALVLACFGWAGQQ
jgi:hypothetical protein